MHSLSLSLPLSTPQFVRRVARRLTRGRDFRRFDEELFGHDRIGWMSEAPLQKSVGPTGLIAY